jgi:electron transfer flavoprotein alpha subunit
VSGVLVVLEQKNGALARISLEALAAGQELAAMTGGECIAALLGDSTEAAAKDVQSQAIARLYTLDDPLLKLYTADGYKTALKQLIQKTAPAFVVLPHTYQARDFAPALAAAFGQSLISDVIAMRMDANGPVFVRQLFQGKLNAEYRMTGQSGRTGFLSVQAGNFRVENLKPGTATLEPFAVELTPAEIRTAPSEPFRDSAHTVDLSAAQVIVSVGRGIREQENMGLVESLATALGAELAASRPICDAGWLPIERQVGSSGQTVAPKVYLAVGISGAIQHLVGIKGSKMIIAINKDEDAPIFEVANYGVAKDLFEIVPELTRAILALKS